MNQGEDFETFCPFFPLHPNSSMPVSCWGTPKPEWLLSDQTIFIVTRSSGSLGVRHRKNLTLSPRKQSFLLLLKIWQVSSKKWSIIRARYNTQWYRSVKFIILLTIHHQLPPVKEYGVYRKVSTEPTMKTICD